MQLKKIKVTTSAIVWWQFNLWLDFKNNDSPTEKEILNWISVICDPVILFILETLNNCLLLLYAESAE